MPTKHPLPHIGDVFGKLTVERVKDIRDASGRLRHFCVCRCECGKTVETNFDNLWKGRTTSCGCVRTEITVERHEKGWEAAQRKNQSGYKGVSYRQRGALRWRMSLDYKKHTYYSNHGTAEEAARAYDCLAIKLRGPTTCINFPEEHPEHPNRKPARRIP